jgi:hypothetical protein
LGKYEIISIASELAALRAIDWRSVEDSKDATIYKGKSYYG